MGSAFLFAIQFLTRLPVSVKADLTPVVLGRSVLFYPVVGAVIGFILWLVAKQAVAVDPMVVAAFVLALWVAITGGLHLDGLADCTDGWIGGQGDRDKTLAIMKDPNAGPMAVIALVLLLILKLSAIAALIKTGSLVALFVAPIMGRAIVPALMMSAPYLRKDGLGKSMVENLPEKAARLVIVAVLLGGAVLSGPLLIIGAVFFGLLLRKLFLKVFGGFTGDVYGAAVELTELFILLGAVCLVS